MVYSQFQAVRLAVIGQNKRHSPIPVLPGWPQIGMLPQIVYGPVYYRSHERPETGALVSVRRLHLSGLFHDAGHGFRLPFF
jgi:hypothetical protein